MPSKKLLTISLYTHFLKFMKIFNQKKSIIGIYTYTLTLNKNLILIIFNYKNIIGIYTYALTLNKTYF